MICRAARGADVNAWSARVPAARFRNPKRHLGHLSGARLRCLPLVRAFSHAARNFAIASSRVAAVPFVKPRVAGVTIRDHSGPLAPRGRRGALSRQSSGAPRGGVAKDYFRIAEYVRQQARDAERET